MSEEMVLSAENIEFWLENNSKLPQNLLSLPEFAGSLDLGRWFPSLIFMQSYGMQKHGKVWYFMSFWRNRDFKINGPFF